MDLNDNMQRKRMMIRLYCKNSITLNSVVAEFPEVVEEVKVLLGKAYNAEVVSKRQRLLETIES